MPAGLELSGETNVILWGCDPPAVGACWRARAPESIEDEPVTALGRGVE